jgi:4-diphosphocytidyl-2-C-methyl-D-erythritol kinase
MTSKSRDDAAWPAPAKLNRFIHVLGRREDGFHDIQTLFQFVDLCDELRFTPREDGAISRSSDLPGVPEAEDIVIRAAGALREAGGDKASAGVDIHLTKRIPMQAGLGGGSSDAATTLHALNDFWSLGFTSEQLAGIGAELGSDVPVFVRGLAAWGEGRGEKLDPAAGLDEPDFLLVCPDCAVSTAEIYAAESLARDSETISMTEFQADGGRNDFQPVVAAKYPAVAEALRWLAPWGDARLTGTGACVFVAVDDEARGREALTRLPDHWQGFLVRGRNRSPLLDRVAG